MEASKPYGENTSIQDVSNYLKLKTAETYATGATRLISFGVQDAWLKGVRTIHSNEREELSPLYRWISKNRHIFKNVECDAKVALVYSFPTFMWKFFPSFCYYDGESNYFEAINGWSKILEFNQMPYDIILLGHEEVFNSTITQDSLSKYDLVICPQIDCISDNDLNTLSEYANENMIITTEDFGLKNEYNEHRPQNILNEFQNKSNVQLVDPKIGHNFYEELNNDRINQTSISLLTKITPNIENTIKYELKSSSNEQTKYT